MKLIYTLFIAVTISLVFFVGTSEQAQDCAGIENGNSTYDGCGVCNGKNNTCGGCDGKGNQIDICGKNTKKKKITRQQIFFTTR